MKQMKFVERTYSFSIKKFNKGRAKLFDSSYEIGTYEVTPEFILHMGSVIELECICEDCNLIFKKTASRIKDDKKHRGEYTPICSECLKKQRRKRTIEECEAISKRMKEYKASLTKEQKELQIEKRRITLKNKDPEIKRQEIEQRVITLKNKDPEIRKQEIARSKETFKKNGKNLREGNPAWKHKEGYERYFFECKNVKRKYIKENNIQISREQKSYFKLHPKRGYELGISPEVIGRSIVVMYVRDRGELNSLAYELNREKNIQYTSFKRYKEAAYRLAEKVYNENIDVLNPEGYIRGKQKLNNDNYHLDHIIPITICWEEGISIEKCSSIENLQLIHWRENISKNCRLKDEHKYLIEKLKG